MRRYNNGRKNTGSYIGPAALAIFLVLNAALGSNGEGIIVALLSIIVIAALIGTVFVLMKKAAKKGTGFAAMKKTASREKAVEDKPSFSTGSGSPAVYNENSAQELFLRDRQKRLEQLDVFLKNGIVDKEEYNLLKKRYENYSYERN